MKLKPFLFGLTAMLTLALGMQQPVFAAKKAKDLSSSSSTHHHKKKKHFKKVLCARDGKNHKACERFKHNIQLQLSDSYGFPVVGSEFWVTLDVIKEGPKVTIQLPLINFQTGPCSSNDPFCPTFVPGGYLYTSDGYLPERVRPTDLVPQSIVAASNNGLSPVFSFVEPLPPQPPTGYIVQVTNAGALQVQCAGTFGNIIPEGPQILMPCSITYVVKQQEKLCKNVVLSNGPTNVTQFATAANDYNIASIAFRDSQVNDAFGGVAAFAWGDNSMEVDKSNGIMQAMVAVGKVKDGKLKMRTPVQLTNITQSNVAAAFDHAVTINRVNKDNIVVSYVVIDDSLTNCPDGGAGTYYRAVSFDGGRTWPYNGPLTLGSPYQHGVPCALDVGDAQGVGSDKYGNIWYSGSIRFAGSGVLPNPGDFNNQPFYAVSVDGGITFQVLPGCVVSFPPDFTPDIIAFDLGTFCFGNKGDASNQYGMWIGCSYYDASFDVRPLVGFIPINGPGIANIGTMEQDVLNYTNASGYRPSLASSQDGRFWFQSAVLSASSYICPFATLFKSPGSLDENYSGPFQVGVVDQLSNQWGISPFLSYPVVGYFNIVQQSIYDDKRQALYSLYGGSTPNGSQNMQVYLLISRDNGLTWSKPINVSSTSFANRGFASMALDTVTGDLVFGFYDGRHDKTYQSVEYMGAIIPSKTLDKLVNAIPLSNPLFIVPSAATPPVATVGGAAVPAATEQGVAKQKRTDRKFETKLPKKALKLKSAKT